MRSILITNDDGYLSDGIRLLTKQLRKKYKVFIVAPDRERSAVSMSLTLNTPIRIKEVGENEYISNGTPIDCINLGLNLIIPDKPDLIVSGMNHGENVSEDIFYSGTLAGAFAGHLHGINSIAVSLVLGKIKKDVSREIVQEAVEIADRVISRIIEKKFEDTVYNLNIPVPNNGKVLMTIPDRRKYVPELIEKIDPRGRKYYWIGTGNPYYSDEFGTDSNAIKDGYISLSSLKYDLTCKKSDYGKIIDEF